MKLNVMILVTKIGLMERWNGSATLAETVMQLCFGTFSLDKSQLRLFFSPSICYCHFYFENWQNCFRLIQCNNSNRFHQFFCCCKFLPAWLLPYRTVYKYYVSWLFLIGWTFFWCRQTSIAAPNLARLEVSLQVRKSHQN